MSRPETATRNEQPKDEGNVKNTPQGESVGVLPSDLGLIERNTDEPFLDPDEYLDPRVHQWRDILRRRYNFNKTHKQ
jgi:hypothetical protein